MDPNRRRSISQGFYWHFRQPGNNQPGDGFWSKVLTKFLAMMDQGPYRDIDSVSSNITNYTQVAVVAGGTTKMCSKWHWKSINKIMVPTFLTFARGWF
ncbi:hypothetical protein Hanom_Chr10g00877101 [Helianthus anomalus]